MIRKHSESVGLVSVCLGRVVMGLETVSAVRAGFFTKSILTAFHTNLSLVH
ncbi:MAG: hypothetical protein NT027_14200 [Proteobacteria bacterium]|nr:hypothetical protein [Pseudomonadota bacterium]